MFGKRQASKTPERFKLNVEFPLVPESLEPNFSRDFPSCVEGIAQTKPGNYITSPVYAKAAEDVYNMKLRADDVFVLSFHKSGSTWMQELVWMVMNNCDYEKAKTSLHARSPFLEMNYMLPKALMEQYERDIVVRTTKMPLLGKLVDLLHYFNVMDTIRPAVKTVLGYWLDEKMRDLDEIDQMASPRIFKSHLPFYLLHPKLLETSKVVYIARNPKDVIVSFFHYTKLMHHHKFTGNLEAFAEYFISDKVYTSPFFPHLLDAWSKRHNPNMLFVFYEDLKRNLRGEVEKVAKFLGKSLSEEQLTKLTAHLRIDKFKQNEAVNYENYKKLGIMEQEGHFVRKGKTGDWKNHFSPELNKKIDDWIAANLTGSDLKFITELDQQD